MKSLVQFIYEKSSNKIIYIIFIQGKNGHNHYFIEDSDGSVSTRYSDWSHRYLVYAIKCNNIKEAMNNLDTICKDTEKSWVGTNLSDLNDNNDKFEKALTDEFGDKSFAKDLIKAMNKRELQDGAADLYKTLNTDFT